MRRGTSGTASPRPTFGLADVLAVVVAVATAGSPGIARGGIPEPDVVLYGQVLIGGVPATAADDVTVIARVDGIAQPVGSYTLGANPQAGNDYVLRIHMEAPAGGPVTNAAVVEQVTHILVCQGGGPETLAANYLITASGAMEHLDLAAGCDSLRPFLVHGGANPPFGQPRTIPCSGYIDPRVEIAVPGGQPAGLQTITLVFSEAVRNAGSGEGGSLTAAAFVVSQIGPGTAPGVTGIDDEIDPSGRHVVTLTLSGPPAVRQWTTIRAQVEDLCANAIDNLGNQGPGVLEPDRIDIGFLPCDIDQSRVVSPVDFLRFRQFLFNTCGSGCPSCDSSGFYYDMDRSGVINAVDVLRFRQWVFGTGPAAQPWNGLTLQPQP